MNFKINPIILSIVSILYFGCTSQTSQTAFLNAERVNVADTIFNRIIKDPYRWLESEDDPASKNWVKQKDSLSRIWLNDYQKKDSLKARYNRLAEQDNIDPPLIAGDHLIYLKQSNKFRQPVLMKKLVGSLSESVLFDPSINLEAKDIVVKDFSPSPNGDLVAIGIYTIGSRKLDYIFQETETGRVLVDTLENANLSKLPWLTNSSVVYNQKPTNKTKPNIAVYHIGKTKKPRKIYESETSETILSAMASIGGQYIIISNGVGANDIYISSIDGFKASLLLSGKTQNSRYEYIGNASSKMFFTSTFQADNGNIIEIDVANSTQKVLIPESEDALDQAHFFGGKLLVAYLKKAKPFVKIFDTKGKLLNEVDIPVGLPWSNYSSNWRGYTGSHDNFIAYHKNLGLTSAGGIFQIDLNDGSMVPFYTSNYGIESSSFVTTQVLVPLQDGNEMPMFLTHRKDIKLDGSNPLLLYVYGAYGWTEIPFINPKYAMFLQAGGIHAMPNLRGGGALGGEWYEGGRKKNKPNTIRDAINAGEWLVENSYTSPRKMLIEGNSAGGLVAMAVVNERPELFGAAILEVPLSDMVRLLQFSGGVAWKSQFGDPTQEKDFDIIYSYSPYHNIRRDKDYPPIFIAPGNLDKTAPALHAYKLAAALQEVQDDADPILLRVNWGGDHNGGNSELRNMERSDELIFIAKTLGVEIIK